MDTDNYVTIGDFKLNSLFYADDLVLLSPCPMGLQNSLNKLEFYCRKWGLKVNLSKTKVIAFNKSGRKTKHTFTYNNQIIENSASYLYLGIKYTTSGTFSIAQSDLVSKARKALFKIYKCVNYPDVDIDIMLKLYNSMIKPILLYGCEIWGTFKNTKTDSVIELMQNKFLKSLLGVNKNASNCAVRGELGQYPLQVFINIAIIKYWFRLATKDCRELLYQSYLSQFRNNEPQSDWAIFVKNLLESHGFSEVWKNPFNFNFDMFINTFSQRVFDSYVQNWRTELSENNKLNSYQKLKHNFVRENYLIYIKNRKLRNSMCKLRISAHPLKIETGRYNKPPIPRHLRICTICNEIEDEPHFLTSCSKFTEERKKMLQGLKLRNFYFLNHIDQYIYMMNNNNKLFVNRVATFIYNCLFKH